MHKCSATTKEGKPCPINAEPLLFIGKRYCHVHHPLGKYQTQQKQKKAKKLADNRSSREILASIENLLTRLLERMEPRG